MDNFGDWLTSEMNNRGFSQAELARRSDVSQSAISLVLSGQRKPGEELCRAIAHTFGYPPETVFRAAGILQSVPPDQEREAIWDKLFREADQQTQEDAIAFLQHRRDRIREPKTQPRGT